MFAWVILPAPPQLNTNLRAGPREYGLLVLAGIAFTGDLIAWNKGLELTTVANATLFVNFAPIFVALISWLILRQRLSFQGTLGMTIAIFGGSLLIWPHLGESTSILGDGLSLVAGAFYGIYLLTVQLARRYFTAPAIMTITSIITGLVGCIMLYILDEDLSVGSIAGWQALVALALVVQVIGQGLVAYALAALPATLSSIMLLMQPVISAIVAWWLFNEDLVFIQYLGILVVLLGIGYTKMSFSKPELSPQP